MKKRREITVSTLGFPQMSHPILHGQEAVEAVMKNFDFQLQFVLPNKPDIIIFPEACDRFSTHTMAERKKYYDVRGEQILNYMQNVAKTNQCYVVYSAARQMADGTYRNSSILLDRQGRMTAVYNKNHCVVTEISNGGILCGKNAMVVETDFGKVGFAICFDLNFHELREQYVANPPDLLLFSSMYQGGVMQNMWAYTIGCYLAGAVANEENTIINPVGEKVCHSTRYSPYLSCKVNLDYQVVHLDFNWDKLIALRKKYGSEVTVFDGGQTGVVLVSSTSATISSAKMCEEFEIELWRNYYMRSLKARQANIEP